MSRDVKSMSQRQLTACVATLTAVLSCGAHSALAMAVHSDCTAPFVFSDADVNVVVLPYRSAAESFEPLGQIGQQFALLAKLDVFSHVLDYGSVGAVQMEVPVHVDNMAGCEPELVMRQVLGQAPGAMKQIAKGHGIVFVWGILYEEQDDIIVQTYARYLRRDTPEILHLKAGKLDFLAKPNTSTIAFSPRLIKKDTIAAMQAAYSQADFVRTAPRDDAPGEPLPRQVEKCFGCGEGTPTAFLVLEKKGDWIRVRWRDPVKAALRDGWIHARETVSGQSLDQILPELSFTEGVVGYLRQRIAESRHEPLPNALTALSERQFQTFLENNDSEQAPQASSVAHQLIGTLEMLKGDRESLAHSQSEFVTASRAAPSDMNGVTLAAISQVAADWGSDHALSNQRRLETQLTAAGTLSDDSTAGIGNLRNFYELLKISLANGAPEEIPAAEINQRLQEIGLVR